MVEPYSRFPDDCKPMLIMERLSRGWKQKDVADILHSSRSGYAQIEAGNRDGTDAQWRELESIFCVPSELLKMNKREYIDYLKETDGGM